MKATIIKTELIKQTTYELIKEVDKEKYWVTKVGRNNTVTFLQPSRTLELGIKFFDKIVNDVKNKIK